MGIPSFKQIIIDVGNAVISPTLHKLSRAGAGLGRNLRKWMD